MPKREELPWEVKIAIWEAKVKSTTYEAAIRALQEREFNRLHEAGFCFDDPDEKTIKKIIKVDINKLSVELVRAKLPPYLWILRQDYEGIKDFTHTSGPDTEVGISNERQIEHDIKVFKESNEIIDEATLDLAFLNLSDLAMYNYGLPVHLSEYLGFFQLESNQYIDPDINCRCKVMWKHLKELNDFLWDAPFVPIKPIYNENGPNTEILCPDKTRRFCTEREAKSHPEFNVLKQQLESLVDNAQTSYLDYRVSIRNKLFQ